MFRLHSIFFNLIFFLLLSVTTTMVNAQITQNTNWSSLNPKPTASTDVTIGSGITVTVDENAVARSITFLGGNSSTLTVNSGFTLNVSGAITLNNQPNANSEGSISGAGSVIADSIVVGNSTTINTNGTFAHTLNVNVANLTVNQRIHVISNIGNNNQRISNGTYNHSSGTLLQVGGNIATTNTVNNSSTLTFNSNLIRMNLGGSSPFSLSSNGTNSVTLAAQTINYNGSSQTVYANASYSNLELTGSGTKTLSATTTSITGNLILGGTASATAVTGLTIGGGLSIASGTTFNASTFTHTLNGNFSNSGTFTQGTSTMNFTGSAAQTINGSTTTTFNNLTINNTNASGVVLNSPINVNGVLNIPASRTLNLQTHALGGATLTTTGTGLMRTQNTSATPIPAGRTWSFWVEYDYSGATVAAQTAVAGTFANLRMNSLHGAKASGNITVNTELNLPRANPAEHASNNPENAHGALEMVKQYTSHTGSDALEYGNYAEVYTPYSKEFSFNSTTMSFFEFSDTYEIGVDDIYEIATINSEDNVELRKKNTGELTVVTLAEFNTSTVPDSDPIQKLYNRSGFNVSIVTNQNNVTNTPGGIQDRLDSHYLDLGSTAIVTGIGDVTGKVRRNTITHNVEYTFGNPFTTLRFNLNGGTTANLPTSVVMFITKGSVRGIHPNRKNTVQRLYQVVRTGGATPITFDLKLRYQDNELNGLTENNLVLWDHHIPYGTNFTPHEHGRTSIDVNNNWVQLSGHGIAYLNSNESAIGFIGENPATPNRKKYWMIYESTTVANNWLGATPTEGVFRFNDSFNWTKGIVPSASDDVVIPSTASNIPAITTIPESVTLKTLSIEPGATLSLPENVVVTLKGGVTVTGGRPSLINRGNITFGAGSKIVFDYPRTANTVIVDGQTVPLNETAFITGNVNVHHVEVINNTHLRASTNSQLTIKGNVIKTSGVLDFDSNPNTIIFEGAGAQSVIKPDGGNGGYHHLIVRGAGAKTLPGTVLPLRGDFADETSASSASTVAFSEGGSLRFAGNSAQQIRATHPLTLPSISIANTAAPVEVLQDLTVTSNLEIVQGATLLMNDQQLSGASLTTTGSGLLNTKKHTSALPAGRSWSFAVDYSAQNVVEEDETVTLTEQEIAPAVSYSKLKLSGSGKKKLTNTEVVVVEDTLVVSSSEVYLEIAPSQKMDAKAATVINNGGNQGIRILAQADAANASFLFGNESGTIPARVQLYSKANLNGSTYNWQYVGFPTNGYSRSALPSGSFIAAFNEPTQTYVGPSSLVPFKGYAITHNAVGRSFEFDGNISNQDQIIPLSYTLLQNDGITETPTESRGFNMIANSFTAAVSIEELQFENAESSVWLFNTGVNVGGATGDGAGQYLAVPSQLATTLGVTQISSLQGFFVKATNTGASVTIPYAAVAPNTNPMRSPAAEEEKIYTIVEVNGEHFSDKVWLFTRDDASDAYDNGWDGRKLFGVANAPQLYAVGSDDRYQVNTTNDLHNLKLGFRKGEDDRYTLRFHHFNTEQRYPGLWLMDLLEGITVDISQDGAEYEFYETRLDADERFKIVVAIDQTTASASHSLNQDLQMWYAGGKIQVINNTEVTALIMVYDAVGKIKQRLMVAPGHQMNEELVLTTGAHFIRAITHPVTPPLRLVVP